MRGSIVTPLSPHSTGPVSNPFQLSSVTWLNSLCWRNSEIGGVRGHPAHGETRPPRWNPRPPPLPPLLLPSAPTTPLPPPVRSPQQAGRGAEAMTCVGRTRNGRDAGGACVGGCGCDPAPACGRACPGGRGGGAHQAAPVPARLLCPQTPTTVPTRRAASRRAPTAPAGTSAAATPATGSALTAAGVRVSRPAVGGGAAQGGPRGRLDLPAPCL